MALWQSMNLYLTSFENIGPVSKPYRTTLEIPGKSGLRSASSATIEDVIVADSLIYNDHFY